MKTLTSVRPFLAKAQASKIESVMTVRSSKPQLSALSLALGTLCLGLATQVHAQATTPTAGSNSQIVSSKDIAQQTRGMSEAPLAYTSFAAMTDSTVRELRLQTAGTMIPADGRTTIAMELTVLDEKGQPLDIKADISLEASGGGRILLAGEGANDVNIDKMDGSRVQPSKQAKVEGGKLRFKVLAPLQPGDVTVRASVAGRSVVAKISALPEQNELFAVGMVEVSLRGYKDSPLAIDRAKDGDAFEQEIKNWRKEFGNGNDGYLGARAALYLKGMISGKDLLTLSYDSDKDTHNGRLFQDIDPDAMYPIYGDSSTRGIDAQSASKLYVRVDRGRNYAMWGDYSTSSSSGDFALSNYNRSLTGVKGHYEEGAVRGNVWVAYDSTRQVVTEIRGAGMSGPYSLPSGNGIKGSEQVELLVRDRNQPGVILKSTPLTRFSDYEFEIFSGRLMFRAPVPSVDSNGNPVSIRVTYEVDGNGQRYATAGADAILKISDQMSVGASVAKDNNPQSAYRVAGVMAEVEVAQGLRLKAEIAQSKGVPSAGTYGLAGNVGDKGSAARVEANYQNDTVGVTAHMGKSDVGFHNPNSPIADGRSEAGVRATVQASKDLVLGADLRQSQQEGTATVAKSKAVGAELTADYQVRQGWTVGGGLRYARQDVASLNQLGSNCSYSLYSGGIAGYDGFNNAGFGLNPNGSDSVYNGLGTTACGNGPYTPAGAGNTVTNTGLFVRSKYDINDKFSVFGEAGRDKVSGGGSSNLYALGAEYRPYDMTRLYVRHERGYAFSGLNGQGVGNKTSLTTFGVDTEYMRDGHLFSEYRLRDASNGREVQHAVGLRNGFNVAEGVRVLTNVEIASTKSTAVVDSSGTATTLPANTTKALGLGVEYTPNKVFKTSGRIEWRDDNQATNYLTTLGVAAKLNQDWSLMAREYSSIVHYDAGGNTQQNRLQIGSAYRPVDNNRFDALGMVELRSERNSAGATATVAVVPKRDVGIMSMHLNYHPSRPWWLSGRMAYKRVDEVLPGMTGSGSTLVGSKWSAMLLGGRIKYDVSDRWTVGVNFNILHGGPGGGLKSRQYAWGPEVAYIVRENLMAVAGYNLTGFTGDAAKDTGFDYTGKGWYLGMRWKFDEDLFKTGDEKAKAGSQP
ncbi:MAG: hypothetical protein ACH34Y_01275 [Brachymonas sp.]